jgi:excisionase family DNA binding protein
MEMEKPFQPLLISVDEACTVLRISRSKFYALVRDRHIVLKKLGPNLSRVVVASLNRYIARLPDTAPGTPIKVFTQEEKEQRRAEADEILAELGL